MTLTERDKRNEPRQCHRSQINKPSHQHSRIARAGRRRSVSRNCRQEPSLGEKLLAGNKGSLAKDLKRRYYKEEKPKSFPLNLTFDGDKHIKSKRQQYGSDPLSMWTTSPGSMAKAKESFPKDIIEGRVLFAMTKQKVFTLTKNHYTFQPAGRKKYKT